MPKEHIVRQGECLASIAARYGESPDAIWNDPANAALKQQRDDPKTLLPGDRLQIPDLKAGEESVSDGQRHKFKYKGKPLKVRVKVMKDPEPEPEAAEDADDDYAYQDPKYKTPEAELEPDANTPFVLNVDGTLIDGTTDGDGIAEAIVSPGARQGMLTLNPGKPEERTILLALGALNPVTEVSGAAQRLTNLGYPAPKGDKESPELAAAVKAFQEQHGLDVSGTLDPATRDKLVEVHGV